nr:hypothetical protein [Tanacetum cinerariifolium]
MLHLDEMPLALNGDARVKNSVFTPSGEKERRNLRIDEIRIGANKANGRIPCQITGVSGWKLPRVLRRLRSTFTSVYAVKLKRVVSLLEGLQGGKKIALSLELMLPWILNKNTTGGEELSAAKQKMMLLDSAAEGRLMLLSQVKTVNDKCYC